MELVLFRCFNFGISIGNFVGTEYFVIGFSVIECSVDKCVLAGFPCAIV